MKHFILLFAISMFLYFAWQYAGFPVKFKIKQFVKKHGIFVLSVFVVLLCGFLGVFYTNSINAF